MPITTAAYSKKSLPCRSISFTNHNSAPLTKNKQFRSNFTIRYMSDKSMETATFNRYAPISQHSKDQFFGLAANGSVNAVRFKVSTSNENKEIIENNIQEEICHKIITNNNNNNNNKNNNSTSKSFFSRLRNSFQSNSKIETNRCNSQSNNENNDYRYMRLKRNRKAARMLGLLVAAFLICWLPYIIFFPISHFYPQLIPNYLNLFIWWLGYLNSTINPFLYVYSNKNIRWWCCFFFVAILYLF